MEDFEPINRADAKSVQVIHTCSSFLGMKQRVGTIDFFPNGGSNQPGLIYSTERFVVKFIV
jgi:hypothetical protein